MRLITSCLLLAAALPAMAQIYQYTDANGNKVFTNQPPDGVQAQTVELQPTNTVGIDTPEKSSAGNAPAADSEAAAYEILALSDLPTEEALRANNGTFNVSVSIRPALHSGHQLQLVLDGKPYGTPSGGTRFTLHEIDRGDHSLAVQVLNGERVLQSSPPVTFTVQRVHLGRNDDPAHSRRPPAVPGLRRASGGLHLHRREGNRVYTDQPPSGRKAQRVELAPGNSVAPPGIRYRPPAAPLEVKPPAYQLLRILFPEPDATLRANSGDVIVTVTSEPALLPGHRYRLLLDGKPAGVPGRSPVFPLKNLDRGTHQVAVEIIDGDGMTVESTPSQPFHLHRVSIAGQPLPEVDTPLVSAIEPSER